MTFNDLHESTINGQFLESRDNETFEELFDDFIDDVNLSKVFETKYLKLQETTGENDEADFAEYVFIQTQRLKDTRERINKQLLSNKGSWINDERKQKIVDMLKEDEKNVESAIRHLITQRIKEQEKLISLLISYSLLTNDDLK
jgi:hypothetical protein